LNTETASAAASVSAPRDAGPGPPVSAAPLLKTGTAISVAVRFLRQKIGPAFEK